MFIDQGRVWRSREIWEATGRKQWTVPVARGTQQHSKRFAAPQHQNSKRWWGPAVYRPVGLTKEPSKVNSPFESRILLCTIRQLLHNHTILCFLASCASSISLQLQLCCSSKHRSCRKFLPTNNNRRNTARREHFKDIPRTLLHRHNILCSHQITVQITTQFDDEQQWYGIMHYQWRNLILSLLFK